MIGPPKRVQGDSGTEVQGAVKVFFKGCGIQHITSRAYHPQAQRKIERSLGTLKNKLRYNILNCVEGEMSFLFFYTNETNEINDYANVYIQIIYSDTSI